MRKLLCLLFLVLSPLITLQLASQAVKSGLTTNVKIGYKPNHFTNFDYFKNDTANWVSKYAKLDLAAYANDSVQKSSKKNEQKKEDAKEKTNGEKLFVSFLEAIVFYMCIGGASFLTITFLGCISLIIAKIIKVRRKKR